MTTVRVARRARFAAVDRRTVADEALSFRALGILTWLLDKPNDWSCDSSAICRPEGREGRDAVRSALKELVDAGYIVRVKKQNDAGQWVTETLVYERPKTDSQASAVTDITESQASVFQSSENRASDSQALRPKTDTESPLPPRGGRSRSRKEPPPEPTRTHQGTIRTAEELERLDAKVQEPVSVEKITELKEQLKSGGLVSAGLGGETENP